MAAVTVSSDFRPFAQKMQREGLPQVFIDTFHFYYDQLVHGATGYITRDDAGPVGEHPPATSSSARPSWRPARRR